MKPLTAYIYSAIVFAFLIAGCGIADSSGLLDSKCTWCDGGGKKNCSWCFGAGTKTCSKCSGGTIHKFVGSRYKDGFQYVYDIDFSGYTQVSGGYINADCDKCRHTGKIKCSNYSCTDGKVKCTWCDGSGKKK